MSPNESGGSPGSGACPNCGQALAGPFCSGCGQRQSDLHRPLRTLLAEWLGAVVAFDSRLALTVGPLIARPGFLTLEYLAGRRVRYVHPLKLYLAVSLVFFIGLAVVGYSIVRVGEREDARVIALRFDDPGEAPGATAADPPAPEAVGEATAADTGELPAWLAWLGDVAALHQEDPAQLDRLFIDRLAKAVFVLVPVFALLLKLLFRRRGMVYVEHLIASLHIHSLAFLALLVGLAVNAAVGDPQGPGGPMAQVAILVHTFAGLRRVYGDGRLRTAAKMAALGLGYLLALIPTMVLALFLTWLTI